MGTLIYGNAAHTVEFDDRVLLHLQIVITAKLRRRESFIFSWLESVELGGGRGSIWLDSTSVLLYRFADSRMPEVDGDWIDALTTSADSGSGLSLVPEPAIGQEMPSTV